MFESKQYDSGRTVELKIAASTTIAKGDCIIDDGNGLLVRATSSATEVNYVALEAKVSTTDTPFVLCLSTRGGIRFEADTNANPVQTDVFTKADLTDHDTLNESTSSSDVFFIEKIVGAAADKKVAGYFAIDKA